MELSSRILEQVLEPSFIFKSREEFLRQHSDTAGSVPWADSQLNPRNRIETLNTRPGCVWRIDGATRYGTQFFTVPATNSVPLRIDTYIRDQKDVPIALRHVLDCGRSVVARSSRVRQLAIARHICNALDRRSRIEEAFMERLKELPFGSKLVCHNVVADVTRMSLQIVPAYDLERRMLSIQKLRQLWGDDVAEETWPEIISLEELSMKQQLHDTISVVTINGRPGKYIFKSTTNEPAVLYHELKILLTMPPHPNIIKRPINLVTKACCFGGKRGVCGMILEYITGGALRDVLPERALSGTLTLRCKVKWSREVVIALIHFRESTKSFYSDLRPDNVLLSGPSADVAKGTYPPFPNVVLVDFEQRGNWPSWTPPELRCFRYLKDLADDPRTTADQGPWRCFVEDYPSVDHGHHDAAWSYLSFEAQEKAMSYSLGLLMYCIFEGLSNSRQNLATGFDWEPGLEFPEFKATPAAIRQLISRCVGNESFSDPTLRPCTDGEAGLCDQALRTQQRLKREGGRLIVGLCTRHGSTRDCGKDCIYEAGINHWKGTLKELENFLATRRYQTIGKTRPTFKEILAVLEQIGS
ncbi:hypothetical protein BU26DRAFT_98340 [Trematosphaeria pertusa]|uniref:Protein kinase domain-containing protein n=1 Tax=Trematosphaeria pertusa TaxID=390896 RepID=A0A6A6I221_9PLEO|nr:uncharacterized protein BU26DRAFT_98340 [Trematosphaeria pertusa]KAF2244326.1 hypothetical protein BU26DRAFT_98340 [Trematosphaeria pertusa]